MSRFRAQCHAWWARPFFGRQPLPLAGVEELQGCFKALASEERGCSASWVLERRPCPSYLGVLLGVGDPLQAREQRRAPRRVQSGGEGLDFHPGLQVGSE